MFLLQAQKFINLIVFTAWSNWGSYGSCSEGCGGGLQNRTRTCNNGKPGYPGCEGDEKESQVNVTICWSIIQKMLKFSVIVRH